MHKPGSLAGCFLCGFRTGNQRASSALMRARLPFGPLMPRYYFDVRRDGATARDRDGVDLPNVAAARAAAKVMAAVMVFDGMSPEEMPGFGIMVRDESGKVLFEVNAFAWTQDPPNPADLN